MPALDLTPADHDLLLSALDDAIYGQDPRENAGFWCMDCSQLPDGEYCEDHLDDLKQCDRYRLLMGRLIEEAPHA